MVCALRIVGLGCDCCDWWVCGLLLFSGLGVLGVWVCVFASLFVWVWVYGWFGLVFWVVMLLCDLIVLMWDCMLECRLCV